MEFSAGQIYTEVDLKPFNTLGVPARAKQLMVVETMDQLKHAADLARRESLEFCLLGEGSNVVLSSDVDGLLALMRFKGIDVKEESADSVLIDVAAGENWHEFVEHALNQGWYGLENLALIPGLVGAAPIQNIGAYGVEVKLYIESVKYYDIELGTERRLSNVDCEFAYRDSVFKHSLKDKAIITSVRFRLPKAASPNISYKALAQQIDSRASARDVFEKVVSIRRAKLPDPSVLPNAGSFFKNPIVSKAFLESLIERYPEVVYFEHGEHIKLAAAWMIDQLGWKQKIVDGIGVHKEQALVVINPRAAKGEQILNFAEQIQSSVLKNFGVSIEIEPRVI